MFVDAAEPGHVDVRAREGEAGVADVVGENLKGFRCFGEIVVEFAGRKGYISGYEDVAESVSWQSLTCFDIIIVKSEI